MEAISYSELRGQLLILEQIKNPSTWVLDAIIKLRLEVKRIENQNKYLSQIDAASKEIDLIIDRYVDLEIKYSISEKKTVSQPSAKIPQIDTGIRLITHISALNKDYTFKKPRSFIFNNKEHTSFINSKNNNIQVTDWKDVLEGVCNLMQQLHPNDIAKILGMHGTKRLYFAQTKNQLTSTEAKNAPRKIRNTNIFMETNYQANLHVERSYQVIELFGHKRDELNFITFQR